MCLCLFPPQHHSSHYLTEWFVGPSLCLSQLNVLVLPGLLVHEQAGSRMRQREIRVEPKPACSFCRYLSLGVKMERVRSCVPCSSHPFSASSAICKVVQVFACNRRSPFQVVYAAQADMSTFSIKKGKGKQIISAGPLSTAACQKT